MIDRNKEINSPFPCCPVNRECSWNPRLKKATNIWIALIPIIDNTLAKRVFGLFYSIPQGVKGIWILDLRKVSSLVEISHEYKLVIWLLELCKVSTNILFILKCFNQMYRELSLYNLQGHTFEEIGKCNLWRCYRVADLT